MDGWKNWIMNKWMTNCLAGSMTHSHTCSLTERLTNWLTDSHWLTDLLTVIIWLADTDWQWLLNEWLKVTDGMTDSDWIPCIPSFLSFFPLFLKQKHRILVPQLNDCQRLIPRQSTVFFLQPDDDTMVTPFDGSQKYDAISAKEYLASRLEHTYEHSFRVYWSLCCSPNVQTHSFERFEQMPVCVQFEPTENGNPDDLLTCEVVIYLCYYEEVNRILCTMYFYSDVIHALCSLIIS